MEIKVLGPGCVNCQTLARNVEAALSDLGLDVEVEKVTDYEQILSYGVMSTPAVVIDDRVVASGRVLSKDEVRRLIEGAK